jgi:tRNA (Thr-GGU) A37 N-methylase
LSVLEVLARDQNVLRVRGMDMLDGTPILDIKPFVVNTDSLPSRKEK